MSISRKILLMMSVSGITFLIVFSIVFFFKNKEKKLIFDYTRRQFQHEVGSILSLHTSALKQVNFDYTYWDEFADNIKNFDLSWYEKNIGTILQSFHFDYVCTYDAEFNILYENSSENAVTGIIPEEIFPEIKESRLVHFYIWVNNEVLEVSGASIHKTDDPSHYNTKPYGYLFIARRWGNQFLSEMETVTAASISFSKMSDSISSGNPYTISVAQILPGWDRMPVMKAVFSREYEVLRLYNEISKSALLILIISVLAALLIFNIAIRHWVSHPLRLIGSILKTNSDHMINLLQKSPGEFGRIGILFADFINQKKDLQLAKENAEKSDKLKSEFLCNMSHEIRTPMNSIMGFSSMLTRPELTPEKRLQFTNIIISNSEQLLRIINDILEISSLETGQVKIYESETNLTNLLNELYMAFNMKAKEKNLTLTLNYDQKDRNIFIDKSKLLKVLNNLLENALKFTKEGYIDIGCSIEGRIMKFNIRDSGIGIESSNMYKIFKRFSQADDSIATNYGGLGLGLAIAFENVELLGGKITVDSQPGIGSDFCITIPYKPVKSEREKKPARQKSGGAYLSKSGTILIAEDNQMNYQYLAVLLSEFNSDFKLIKADNGKEAVEICKTNPNIDLVLMDIKMPILDGFEAAKAIRSFRTDLPIVAQTAYVTPDDISRIKEAGCDAYLSKPLNPDAVMSVIKRFLPQNGKIN